MASCTGTAGDRRTGRVVSYDTTKGLGWVLDINDEGKAVRPLAVHFSEIRPAWPDDKLASRSTLLQGEYVEYGVGPNPKHPSRTCCKDVTGLGGGPLMMDHAVMRRVLRRSRDFDARATHEPDVAGSRRGRVTSYHARKGWGWIKDLDSDEAFFVHFSEILHYWRDRLGAEDDDHDGRDTGSGNFKPCLFTGECVQFELGSNPFTNQTCAKRVTGPRRGPLLMDFGTYRYVRYRTPGPSRAAAAAAPEGGGASPTYGSGSRYCLGLDAAAADGAGGADGAGAHGQMRPTPTMDDGTRGGTQATAASRNSGHGEAAEE
jgi:cold shock CspA family protein